MEFPRRGVAEHLGMVLGFGCSYTLFTAILYLILRWFHKIPPTWTVLHIASITLVITGTAEILRRLLR